MRALDNDASSQDTSWFRLVESHLSWNSTNRGGVQMRLIELRHQPERTRTYLGSPSIVRLPDGALLAAHDYFGRRSPRNRDGEEALTSVYRSEDNGKTWHNTTHIINCFWSSLFVHRESAYILGTSQRFGSIVIRRSADGGHSWSHPTDEQSGLLFRGGPGQEPPNYHCAPVPILRHAGRIYRAFEDCVSRKWPPVGAQSLVISAAEDSNLLEASSWTQSNRLLFDPAWVLPDWSVIKSPAWLEGNVVLAPNGEMWNVLRFHSDPLVDRAAIVKIHDGGRRITFDPANGFIDFPGGMSKFTIRRDPVTKLYLTLANNNTDPAYAEQRNVLSLCASEDLLHWRHVKTLLEDDTGLSHEDSIRLTGFQYADWQFDGDNIIFVVRMAYRGAVGYHDANRITFHVLENFRRLPRSS